MTAMDTKLLSLGPGCRTALFVKREKRFLVQVDLDGRKIWVHTNNSGSMLGLLKPGRTVLISPAANPARKLPYTLEMMRVGGVWVGVNTLVPNRMLRHCFEHRLLPEFSGYTEFRAEVKVGGSRLDARLRGPEGDLWVEAKNVTLVEDEVAYFPDAVTVRGQKHLQELMNLAAPGVRVACFYLIQRSDARCFGPADFIDPAFADLVWKSREAGVELWPYQTVAGPHGIGMGPRLPVVGR